ncbi:MAG: class I SAM-dependent methyltransferase [Thermoplasmata archaeon]|nr:class I SAM-dependent methyltransferase [Thermoplasmata archaeon]
MSDLDAVVRETHRPSSRDRRTRRLPSMRWPPPLPSRVEYGWLLRLPLRRLRVRRRLARIADVIGTPDVIVDVGSGTGVTAEALAARFKRDPRPRFVLVDPQRGFLTRARRRPKSRFDLVEGDATRVPLGTHSVGVVVSFGVLCCLTEEALPHAIREAWRILRPGGYLLVSVPRWQGPGLESQLMVEGFVRLASERPGVSALQKPS